MHLNRLFNPSGAESWLGKIKMFTVEDEFNPETHRASTVVKIYYRNWWRFRRTHRFFKTDTADHPSVESYQRPPEAQALIEKLKHATGNNSRPMRPKGWRSRALRS